MLASTPALNLLTAKRRRPARNEERLATIREGARRRGGRKRVSTVLEASQEFCCGFMADDMTLLVGRGQE